MNELRAETQEWVSNGHRVPQLVAVLVGQDPASKIYVKNKMKAAEVVGCYTFAISYKYHQFSEFINKMCFS